MAQAAAPDPRTLARVPLGRGLAQGEADTLVAPGSVGEANNVVVNRAGRYDKRRGWGLIPALDEGGSAMLTSPDRVDSAGREILQTDRDGDVYSWGPGRGRWESVGWLPPFSASHEPLVRTQAAVASGGLCRFGTDGKYELAVFQYLISGGGGSLDTYGQIRDAETGAVIGRDALVWSPARLTYPVVFRVGDTGWVVYAGGDVRVAQYRADLTFPDSAISTAITVLAFDAAPVDGASRAFVAFVDTAALTVVQLRTRGELNTAIASNSFAHAANVTDVFVLDGFSGEHAVIVCDGATGARRAYLYRINATTLAVVGVAIVIVTGWHELMAGGALDEAGNLRLYVYGRMAASTDPSVLATDYIAPAGVAISGSPRFLWRTLPLARPFRASDGLYLPVGAQAGGEGYGHYCLIRLDSSALVPEYAGCVIREIASGLAETQHWVDTGDSYQITSGILARSQAWGRDVTGLNRITLTEARSGMGAVDLPQQFVWGGAGLFGFDGYVVQDVNFVQPPHLSLPVSYLNAAGTAFFAAGDYLYRARYEYLDDQNVMHVSPWSNDLVVTVAPAATYRSIDINISTTQLTFHGLLANRSVTLALYRSEVDGVVDGVGTLYRLTGYGLEALAMPYDQATVPYNDDENDATNPELGFVLTSGGPLEAETMPPVVAICKHHGRLWAASAESDRTVWYSQELQTDETPRFNSQLRVQLGDAGENITGIASSGDRLAIFTRSSIYYVVGDGPTDTGAVDGFDGPYQIHGLFGCVDPGSIVSTSRGTYFRASSGICLLDVGGGVTVVGDPVRDLLDGDGAQILHAVYHEADARVVFHFVSDEVEGQSRLLIYDERHAIWTTASSLEVSSISRLAYHRENGALLLAGTAGAFEEGYGASPGFDGAEGDETAIVASLYSPWLRPGGEVGSWAILHAIHFEGEACGPSEWEARVAYEYDPADEESATIDLSTYARGDRVAWQIAPKRQTGQAWRVGLVESIPAEIPADVDAPSGCSWWGLTVDVERQRGLARVAADKRGGTALWGRLARSARWAGRLRAGCSVGRSARASAWLQEGPSAAGSMGPSTRPIRSIRIRSTRACTTRRPWTRSRRRPRRRRRKLRRGRPRRLTGR